jgi:hypothetical protein
LEIVYYHQTQFNDALARMLRSGGVPQQAARKVREIIGAVYGGGQRALESSKLTKHGENRIKHCVKFDLPGYHRLICTLNEDIFTLLFVGSHEECEKWLDNNRGLKPIVDKRTRRVAIVSEVKPGDLLPTRPLNLDVATDRPLLSGLHQESLDALPVTPSLMMRLTRLTATASDEELQECAGMARSPDNQMLLLNVLLALRDGNCEGAMALIAKASGRATSAEDEPAALRDAIHSEVNADTLVNLRELSDIEIEHLFSRATFREWLTFLHPDQKRLVTATFGGPAVITGVSGSGKTSVLVHRAKHLATKYPQGRVLIVTLNTPLAALISSLIDELCPDSVRQRIDAWSVRELCQRIIRFHNPAQHLLTEDKRSGEDLEDCWDDSFAWEDQWERLTPIVRSLRDTYAVDAIRYLRDEFIWVRSGLRASEVNLSELPHRDAYIDPEVTPREGRSIPFSVDWRKRILAGLQHYEEWLTVGGFVDEAALSLEAHRYLSSNLSSEHPFKYQAVLVDEMQDLGSVELEIIRGLAPQREDGLLLTGDSNQQVFPKSHSLSAAGIRVSPADRRYLRKNYRNTRPILAAGLALLESFGRTDLLTEAEARAISPELSTREGPKPLAIAASDRSRELTFVAQYVAQQLTLRPDAPIGIVVCGLREDNPKALSEIQKQLLAAGLVTRLLSQESGLLAGGAYLSALETVKGFEFGLVLIARCSEVAIPDQETHPDERWREARRLYVAMTRGRDEVVFTYAGKASEYIVGMKDFVQYSNVDAQGLGGR